MSHDKMQLNTKYYYLLHILFLLSIIILILPSESFATPAESDAISQTLCNIIAKLTGPIGKGIATIAIVVLGIGLFLGKLSWAVAVATAIGIGLIFGAASIVDWVGKDTGGSATLTCNTPPAAAPAE